MVMPPLVLSCTAHCPAPPATSLPQPIWHLISWDCGKTTSDDISDISMQKCGWCWVDCGDQEARSVVNNAMYHSCPPFCIALDRWSVWLLYHPGPLLSDLLPWWCYCWWCWWPGGEQCITLVPSFVSLLYHSALLLSAGWSLVLSTNQHWSLPKRLRQIFVLLKYYKMQYMIYLKLSQESL